MRNAHPNFLRRLLPAAALVLALLVVGMAPVAAQAPAPQKPDTPAGPLFLPSVTNAQEPVAAARVNGKGWSVLANADRLVKTLEDAGFTTQEGDATFVDLVHLCCDGIIPDTLANNPWPNTYVSLRVPPPQGSDYRLPLDWQFQLGADEAVVFVGLTPPPATYFSYQTFAAVYPGKLMRNGVAIGDTVNIGTVRTTGPDPFNQPIVYILTGNRIAEQRVRAAVRAAGYPDAIVNVETISPIIAPLGVGAEADGKTPKGTVFFFGHRVAAAEDQEVLRQYVQKPPYRVFRVTPKTPLANAPEPVPVLRVRGTGHTEMELYPALNRLREAIVTQYAGMTKVELETRVWQIPELRVLLEKPYAGYQRNLDLMGATRDTNYLSTYPNIKLSDNPNDFVIVYGVNHQKTGKVTYASVGLYADARRWFGVSTVLNRDFAGTARKYLPDDPEADMLYAIKYARDCDGEAFPSCVEVKVDFKDIYDQSYSCPPLDLDEDELFFLFRSYMEPATKVGPDDNELVYDRAIHFGP
jgi:hypothetical protein